MRLMKVLTPSKGSAKFGSVPQALFRTGARIIRVGIVNIGLAASAPTSSILKLISQWNVWLHQAVSCLQGLDGEQTSAARHQKLIGTSKYVNDGCYPRSHLAMKILSETTAETSVRRDPAKPLARFVTRLCCAAPRVSSRMECAFFHGRSDILEVKRLARKLMTEGRNLAKLPRPYIPGRWTRF
nr:hypothetical protein CFP56_04577 [Quercus suber]